MSMRYLLFFLLPVLLSAQSVSETLANYHLSAGDFTAAKRFAEMERDVDRSAELLQEIEQQRVLALTVSLAGAERALAQCDWAQMRKEVARALAAEPKNERAQALAQWMADRGIVRAVIR